MAAPSYICGPATGSSYLTFPDGEVIAWKIQNPASIIPPFVDQSTVDAFIRLNWMMRPPLSTAEIQLMPAADVIGLYYSIKQVKGYDIIPNPLISAGLGSGQVGANHEENLQSRIFNLRSDLWQVTSGNKVYRVLLPPNLLNPPKKPDKTLGIVEEVGLVIADVVVSIVFSPLAGAVFSLGTAALSVAQQKDAANHILSQIHASASMIKEVTAGIDIANQTVVNPSPDPSLTSTLSANYSSWVNYLPTAIKLAASVNASAMHICDASYSLIELNGGLQKYMANWKPYQPYFYSKAVGELVFPEASAPASTISSLNAPVAAGIGIGVGALLLLLL
jgi:hypothetical protein